MLYKYNGINSNIQASEMSRIKIRLKKNSNGLLLLSIM